jgi:hypothetical protein
VGADHYAQAGQAEGEVTMSKDRGKAVDFEYIAPNGNVYQDTVHGTKEQVEKQLDNLSRGGEIEILPPKKK